MGPVSGVVDRERNEVRMTAPLAMVAPYDRLTSDVTLSKLLVISWYEQDVGSDTRTGTGEADETGGGGRATYRLGTSNCVVVGR